MRSSARLLAAAAAALPLALVPAAPRAGARAQWVVTCPTCASLWDQLRQTANDLQVRATQVQQYTTQVRQFVLQGQQYANMVQNTIAIPRYVWTQVQSDVRAVQGLLGSGSQFTLSSGFDVGTLGSYAGYLGQLTNMPDRYAAWSRMANDNVAALMRGLGTAQQQMTGAQATLQQQQELVQVSSGQVQAIQAHAMLTASVAAEVQRLQQIQLAQAQMQANLAAQQADRDALAAASWTRFMAAPAPAVTGGQRF